MSRAWLRPFRRDGHSSVESEPPIATDFSHPVSRALPQPSVSGVLDPSLAAALARDGYVRVGPLLDASECESLERAFDEVVERLGGSVGERWFPTILLPDPEVRAYIDEQLRRIVLPKLQDTLDLEVLDTVRIDYSVKPPGEESHLGPHQDYSIVDEQRWTSLYIWIPLIATSEQNGTLYVLPGSHRFSNSIRSRHVPSMFDPVLAQVEQAAVRLDCEPGELVIMVSGVVHFSPPNRTNQLRLAAHGIFKPAEAPLTFYFADERTPASQVEVYQVEIDDYIGLVLGERPDERFSLAGLRDRQPTEMAPERFAAGMAALAEERRADADPRG